MAGKSKKIGRKVSGLLLWMLILTILLAGGISVYGLYSLKEISMENSMTLGQTAAEGTEQALEEMAVEQLHGLAVEKAAFIEEKFTTVESYVLGIAALAADIYDDPDKYPDRPVELPVQDSKELAAQLLWSANLSEQGQGGTAQSRVPFLTKELLKLGNVQDLLVQYNAYNDMVSSTYIATESGWMIQADYIAYSKYGEDEMPLPYEASDRQWYRWARDGIPGQIIYTDVIRDIHEGGDCIVCASPIYYNGEVVAVAGVGSYLETVKKAVLDTAIGEGGYAFLVNEKGQVIASGRPNGETAAYAEQEADLRESDNVKLAQIASRMVRGLSESTRLTLDGREVYLSYAPLDRLGWSFVTVMDIEEIIAPAQAGQEMILALTEETAVRQNQAIRHILVIFVMALATATVFVSLSGTLFSKKITEPIRSLTSQVAQIDGGNLDYRIHIATGDEVEDLGNAFNHMTAQVQSYVDNLASVTAEKERIRSEIQLASRLQADMLPDAAGAFSDRTEFQLAASMVPAKGVGGDFYDFFLLDDDHLVLVMADVSGKGVPAALFMVVSRTLIRSCITGDIPLEQAVEEINNRLCSNNKNGMFVTAWMGVLTLSTGDMDFVNAGHCRPLIRRQDGVCKYDSTLSGFVLAGMDELDYMQGHMRLHQGDTLLLYTDGVTEATSLQKELYGEERLKVVMEELGEFTPEELLKKVWLDVDSFQREAEQFDDITMLALTYNGTGFQEKTGTPSMELIGEFTDFVDDELKKMDVSMKNIMKFRMTIDEIYSNICYYSGAREVSLGVSITEDQELHCRTAVLYFEDDGIPYNPLDRPDPDVEELLEKRNEGGLGIYLVKKRMDWVTYEYQNGRNRLTVGVREQIDNER